MATEKRARRGIAAAILGAGLAAALAAAPATAAQRCGGNGGRLEFLTCPAGQYVVGLSAKGERYLDRLGIRCAPFNAAGKRGAATYSASAGGSGGSEAASGQCSGNQAVARLTVRSGAFVDQLSNATCAKRIAAGGFAPPTAGTEGLVAFNVGTFGGQECSVGCPPGSAIRKIQIAYGWWIDSIEVACAPQ